MPKLKFPPKVKKKRYRGEYREIDRQVLQWQRMKKLGKIEIDDPYTLAKRLERQRLKRLKQAITAEKASKIDFFGEAASTPLENDNQALLARFKAFKKGFNKL